MKEEYVFTVIFSGNATITVEADSEEEAQEIIESTGPVVFCGNGTSGGLLGWNIYDGVKFGEVYIDDVYPE